MDTVYSRWSDLCAYPARWLDLYHPHMIELQEWVDELRGLIPDVILPEQLAEASFELTQSRYIGYIYGGAALLSTNYYISDIRRIGDNYLFCWIPSKRVD